MKKRILNLSVNTLYKSQEIFIALKSLFSFKRHVLIQYNKYFTVINLINQNYSRHFFYCWLNINACKIDATQ